MKSSDPSASSSYTLATGVAGSERLELQHQAFSVGSYAHVARSHVQIGMVVYDIGCGNGTMTEYLANLVGEQGRVVAVDISAQQLDLVKDRITKAGLANVTFEQLDIQEPNAFPEPKADRIYSRLVLMHTQNPEMAIANYHQLLKPNGCVISQESIMSAWQSPYQTKIFENYVQTALELGKRYGVDYDIGQKLKTLYENAGFIKVEVDYQQQAISAVDAKRLLLLGLAEKRDKTLQAGIVDKETYDLWENTANELPIDLGLSFYSTKQAYVVAWK